MNVEAGAFFKPEVIGQATFITQLGNVAKDWIHFQKERRLYHTSSSFRWRRSVLQESLVFIDALATKIGRKMDEISKITLNPLQLLMSVGSVSITMKLRTLNELAGNLIVLQDCLEDATLRLQRRNAQIRVRALAHHEEVTVRCLNCSSNLPNWVASDRQTAALKCKPAAGDECLAHVSPSH